MNIETPYQIDTIYTILSNLFIHSRHYTIRALRTVFAQQITSPSFPLFSLLFLHLLFHALPTIFLFLLLLVRSVASIGAVLSVVSKVCRSSGRGSCSGSCGCGGDVAVVTLGDVRMGVLGSFHVKKNLP